MARRSSAKSNGNVSGRETRRKPLGAVRRAQQITTYGVGSMIAIGDQSYIVSGLDTWGVYGEPDLREPRLEQRLGVAGFRLPPAAPAPTGNGVKVRRFPQTYSCPRCTDLRPFRDFGTRRNENVCGECGAPLTPSRFVVACADGHLDEFPYWRWLHARRSGESRVHRVCDPRKAELKLKSEGRTATLRGIVIKCDCGEQGSLEGAFGRDAMAALAIGCRGGRPWHGADAREADCDSPLRVLQRGSSAAWFPEVRSALSIPPWHDELMQLVMGHRKLLLGVDPALIGWVAGKQGWLDSGRYTVDDVVKAVRTLEDATTESAGEETDEITELEAGNRIRQEEYHQLCAETKELPENRHFVCVPPAGTGGKVVVPGIDRTMLVKRLREVRALRSFTRIEPLMRTEADRGREVGLALSDEIDWLPAIEVIGEGVFLTLDREKLADWESSAGHGSPAERTERIRRNDERQLRTRTRDPREDVRSPVTTRFVLLHTLAHALINEWSLDCGYPASAIRERLYVNDDMAGVLLYTATSDSAGSLGGIIAQGEPERLAASLGSALKRVSWCSADPLCMEADASGVNSLNLAACHACVLLPETSCEMNNTFLDRAMLIGTPDGRTPGFFS
ncbi:DrmB family protein [Streptomyces sp. NPDC091292]|uniref:DrmB family protein n=1 Tax=Streptomyces sp. NPDC091292 TaxID=3365991 RepID=UPI00382878EB